MFIWILVCTLVGGCAVESLPATGSADIDGQILDIFKESLEKTRIQLRSLSEPEYLGRANIGEKLEGIRQKLKDMWSCESDTSCQFTIEKDIKLPKVKETFNVKASLYINIDVAESLIHLKLVFGPLTIIEKPISFKSLKEVCKKLENHENIEACFGMQLTESVENGLKLCPTCHANIMDIFNQTLIFPCMNFKAGKLSLDDNLDDYDQPGVKLNIKQFWKKVVQFVKYIKEKLKKPQPTPA